MPQGAHTRPGRSAGGSPSLSRAWRRAPHGPACDAIRRCTGHHSIPVARRSTGPRPSASPLAANRSPPVAGQTLSAYRVMWWRNWTGSCPTQQNVKSPATEYGLRPSTPKSMTGYYAPCSLPTSHPLHCYYEMHCTPSTLTQQKPSAGLLSRQKQPENSSHLSKC
jgi:hypothetical protein